MKKRLVFKSVACTMRLVVLLLVVVACGNDFERESSTSAVSEKTLTIAVGGELTNFYPLNMNAENAPLNRQVYESLLYYDRGEIKPGLVREWSFDGTGTELTFKLQEGVTFHDGMPFNAETCKQNLEYYKEGPNGGFLKGYTAIQSIDVIDEYTLVIHYPTPYYAYLLNFTKPDVYTMVSPAVIEAGNYDLMKAVVGTGPYKFDERVEGAYTRLVRNDAYWGDAPQFDAIVAKYIPESSSRLQALQTGEVDVIYGELFLSWEDYSQALTLSEVKGQVCEVGSRTRNMVLNASSEKLSDLKVREAVAYAVNKEALAMGLTDGHEEVADRLFPKATPFCDVEIDQLRTYDLDKANALLDEAGWRRNPSTGIREKEGEPLEFSMIYELENALNADIATVIKSQLAQCGIDVQLNGMEQMQWWQAAVEGRFDGCLWYTPVPQEPSGHFIPILDEQVAAAASTRGLPDGDAFREAIRKTTATDDPKVIQALMTYLLNYSNDNVIDIPLTYSKDMIVYRSSLIEDYTFYGTPRFFEASGLKLK